MNDPHKHYFHFDNSLGKDPIKTQYFTLWQVGDLFLVPNEFVPEHDQFCFEITLIERGNGEILAANKTYRVQKNDLQFSFENEKHVLRAADSPFRFFYIALTPAPNTICETIIDTLKEHCKNSGHVFAFPEVFETTKNLLSEFYNKSVFYKEKIESLIMNILISVYRKIATDTTEKQMQIPGRKDELIYNIINYIGSKQNKLVTLKEIADNFSYAYDYISNSFKEVMQIPLRDYLYDTRLNAAKNLLLGTDKNITEISAELGYSCIHSFSRSFKAKFGVSPQKMREENSNKSE